MPTDLTASLADRQYRDRERFIEVYGHEPEADAEKIVDTVRTWWEEQDPAMWERFHRWVYNIRFTDGDQWLVSLDGRTWYEPQRPTGAVRVTNNLTHRAIEYRIAKLTENRPTGKVLPHSNEVIDMDRAEAGQQLLHYLERVRNIGARYEEALWYDQLCGCGFIYVGWEAETGEFVAAKKARLVTGPDGMPHIEEYFVNADGEEVTAPDEAFIYQTGDVCVEVLPPWAIRVNDPQETDPDRIFRWMWGTVMDVAEIKRRFGAAADEIKGGGEYDQYTYYEDLVNSWSNTEFRRRPREKPYESRALVIRVFEKPSPEYPKGRYIVVCEDTLLAYGPLPYGDIPFVQVKTSHRPHDFYGRAAVEDLIPIQKRINQLESHAIEYIRLFSKGGLTAEYGTVIEESWHDVYGSVLYYSGDAPTPLSWPGMPSDVWEALRRAYENFDRVSGWGDVARGDVPPGVKAAKAILELKRSNDTPLGRALQRFDEVVERVSTKLIERARWGYIEPHFIQILGADVPHLTRAISSDDLPLKFSVKVESDSMLRLSYPAKLELLFELAERGWIDQDSAMRLLNFGTWEHRSGQWNRDYARARLKIEMLMAGLPVSVEWWENDAIHMLALEERLKDPRFEELPPTQREALTFLWLQHYAQWQMKQQGVVPPQIQMAMQAVMGSPAMGAPGMAPPSLSAAPGQPGPTPPVGMMPTQGPQPQGKSAPDLAGAEAIYNPVDVTAQEAAAGF